MSDKYAEFAFPRGTNSGCQQQGMTLRDYFAGQAIVGLISQNHRGATRDDLAVEAYRTADAMLAYRSTPPAH